MRELILAALAILAAFVGLSFWKRREAEGSGRRQQQQADADKKREEFDRQIRALRAEKALRLAEQIEQDAREAEARRLADAATTQPIPAPASAEEVLEQARKEQEGRSRIQ